MQTSFGMAMTGPAFAVLRGSRVTLYSVRLPFLNTSPVLEYSLNMCWEIFKISIPKFTILDDAINITSDLVACDLNQLSIDMESNHGSPNQWIQTLKSIFMKTLRMDQYAFHS